MNFSLPQMTRPCGAARSMGTAVSFSRRADRLFAYAVSMAWVWLLLAGGGHAWAQGGSEGAAKVNANDRPVAKVNGMPIMASDLRETMEAQEQVLRFQYAGDVERLKKELAHLKITALDTLIDCQILIDEFYKEDGVLEPKFVEDDMNAIIQESFKGDREAFVEELGRSGMTVDRFREVRVRMILINAMRTRLAGEIELKDEAVRAHYDKHKERWLSPESVKFHTVTIGKTTPAARKVAEGLREKLVKGGDFAAAARAQSIDSHADDGGEWPWMKTSDLDGVIHSAATKTKKGALSEVLEQQDDYVILRVDERKEAMQQPFEKVKGDVEKSLREEVGREHFDQRMIRLREKADIQKLGAL